MSRTQPFLMLRLAAGGALAVVVAVGSARSWMAHQRAGWDPHYGDPDGESIVRVVGFLLGAATLLAAAVVLAALELALWLRRRRAGRTAEEAASASQERRGNL